MSVISILRRFIGSRPPFLVFVFDEMAREMLFPALPEQPMDYFEALFRRRGYEKITGVDEAGRGPLAGPVVAAAVILPEEGVPGQRIFDSKRISPSQREYLLEAIRTHALSIGIGIVSQQEIDELNILQASLKAMVLAIKDLSLRPDFVLIDGPHGINLPIPQKPIPKGDQLSISIASASIVAKVTRDRLMAEYDRLFPQYGFAIHKGYGTREHREAIRRHGVCELHRKTFRGVKEYL
jgi:ribonuclease HII